MYRMYVYNILVAVRVCICNAILVRVSNSHFRFEYANARSVGILYYF